jgi:hypothetical protein
MAYEISPYAVRATFPAGADLSASQYRFVKMSGASVVGVAAITDKPIGVLQNDPTQGKEAVVTVVGGTKIKGAASLAAGNSIFTAANGTASPVAAFGDAVASTTFVAGQVILATGAASEIATAVINCANIGRGA